MCPVAARPERNKDMRRESVRNILIAGVFVSSLFSACSTANKTLYTQASIESRNALAAGDFQKAVLTFKAACKKNPGNKKLEAHYVLTVEEIRRAADRAMGRKDYAQAASIYLLLSNNYADFGAFAAKLTFKKAYLDATLKYCRIELVSAQAGEDIKAGNFAKALNAYQAALDEYPGDAGLAGKYVTAIGDIKAAGDKALTDKNFGLSGKANALLLKNFPTFERLLPAVAFTQADLTKAIAVCRDSLTKTGLAEYRQGNLAKAIAVWEELLSFDPENAEIKKAVDTARTQLNAIINKK
jgi:tetratricopeptide (TPR) repeat protein